MKTQVDNPEVSQSPVQEQSPSPDDQNARQIAELTVNNFSIVAGGLVYNLLPRSHIIRETAPDVTRRIVVIMAITWLPLLLLSLSNGTAFGHQVRIPFLYDFTMYGRLMIAIPLLLFAEIFIDPQVKIAVKEFVEARLVPDEELPAFEKVLRTVQRLRDSWIVDALLLVLAFFPIFLFQREWLTGAVTNWHNTADGLSAPGWFYALVSAPIMRYITYRWVFRYLLWAVLQGKVSRLKLTLVPTHPDRAAGVDFVAAAQKHFGILACALCCSVAGRVANMMVFEGAKLKSFEYPLVGFVVLSVIAGLLPLALWFPILKKVRKQGLLDYGRLAQAYTGSFDGKWVHYAATPSDQLLGTPDLQSLADLGNSFSFVEKMRWAPISRKLVQQLTGWTIIPLIPVIIYGTPTSELIGQVIKLIN